MLQLTNQKIEFYKLTNQRMLRSIRSAKWTAALNAYVFRDFKQREQTNCLYIGMSCFESEVWRQEHAKWARPRAGWKGGNLCGSCSKIWAAKRMMSFSINVSTLSRFTAIFNFGIVSLPLKSCLVSIARPDHETRRKTQFWLIKGRIVALNDQANQIQYIFCKTRTFYTWCRLSTLFRFALA